MKKTILTAMLFFAFLVVGVQNATAQFVTNDQATIILAAETQSAINDPGYSNATNKDATWQYLNSKIVFYTTVKDQIAAGSSVETAIQESVLLVNTSGSIDFCCIAKPSVLRDQDGKILDISTTTLKDAWNSDAMKDLRLGMILPRNQAILITFTRQ